jgi:hypothetical protein
MTYPTGLLPLSPPLSPLAQNTTINQWLDSLKTSWVGSVEPPATLIADGMLWLDTSTATPRLKFRMLGNWIYLLSNVGVIIDDCDDAITDGHFRFNSTALNVPFSDAGSLISAARANGGTQLAFRQNSSETNLMMVRTWLDAAGTSWTPWRRVFTQADIVGTVSVALGVPSGAVIESGSNSNGAYLRLADGMQICWHREVVTFDSTARLGGTWTFAKPFVSTGWRASAVIAALSITPNASNLGQIILDLPSATKTDVYLYRVQGLTNFSSGDNASIDLQVNGFWK